MLLFSLFSAYTPVPGQTGPEITPSNEPNPPQPHGRRPCNMDPQPVRRFWSACAAGLDCTDDGTHRWLNTPTVGPVVKEAHLVTVG